MACKRMVVSNKLYVFVKNKTVISITVFFTLELEIGFVL